MADGTLTFNIIAKDAASKTFAGIGKAASGLGKGLAAVGKGGALGLAAVGAGVLALGPQLVDAAANMQLMENKSKIVFGDQIGRVRDWAAANANAMGLTKREATGLAASFADLLVPMGFSRKQAAGMATDVIGLSGALSQWSGGTRSAAEVSEILSAAMLGERDALQGLGISISQAEIDAKLLTKGQKDLTGAALQQAEALATQELIFAKSKDAQDAFAKSGGTLATKLATSKARLKEMGETLLVTATPAIMSLADAASKHVLPQLERFVTWLSGPGKFQIADFALGAAESFLTFASTAIRGLASVLRFAVTWGGNFLGVAAAAFGWMPGLGPKLFAARKSFEGFGQGVLNTLDKAAAEVDGWNGTVGRMRKELKLKADISQLEQKLASAKTQLKDKNLTKERRAAVNANIEALKRKIREAKRALDSIPDETVYVNYVGRSTSGQNRGQDDMGPRALGGPVRAGGMYQVGERGPEWFVPEQDGTIVPNGANLRLGGQSVGSAAAAAPNTKVEVHIHGHALASKLELENLFTETLQRLTTQGRLRFAGS
ncbi:hypothetical protein [Tenggerimyces flavus]|uniref:Uncharacterized protein n=1 Tax=Tenggerimyces flavus TaxID=1708749 RepID=A0ABV7YLR5_9ACTN|nr:hypothetical protein [Tenggerimyces flavus]MBM7787785.1 hypothetical protein [Tenggerimyces flavus]